MTHTDVDVTATWPKLECDMREKPGSEWRMENPSYWGELPPEQKAELNKQRSIQRTRTKLRRICTHKGMKYFWTLTFAKKKNYVKGKWKDAGELSDAWSLWRNFIVRCRRAGLNFPYVVVIEVQEKRLQEHGEKVYHFHFVTNENLPIDQKKAKKRGFKAGMLSLWGHGRIDISTKKGSRRFADRYLLKYISKMFDETKTGTHRYKVSEGVMWPTEVRYFETEGQLDWFIQMMCAERDLTRKKEYLPLNDGYSEVLVYMLEARRQKGG